MAWESDSERRKLLPPDWNKIRAQRLKMDGYQCTWRLPKSGDRCPRKATDVDHKYGRENHSLNALRSLCDHHHKQVTQKQAWAGRMKPRTKKREPERHPGRLL